MRNLLRGQLAPLALGKHAELDPGYRGSLEECDLDSELIVYSCYLYVSAIKKNYLYNSYVVEILE